MRSVRFLFEYIPFIDKIIDSGITVFKLEGRGRSADYVSTVTKVYKDAINIHLDKIFYK